MRKYLGALCIMFAAALWGLDGVLLRPRLYHLFDFIPLVVLLEHAIAFGFMLPFFIYEIRQIRLLGIREWGSLLWVAVFGGVIGTMAITKALFLVEFNHLSVIVILQKLQPVFAIILAILLLKERPKASFYGYAALALVGSYLLTFGLGKPQFHDNVLFTAALFSLLAAFSFGSATVFGKRALKKAGFRLATYLRFGLTALILLGIVGAQGFSGLSALKTADILTIVVIALSTGGFAILIYYYGLKQVPASKSTLYELAFPVTVVLLDMIVNKSFLSAPQYLGGALIVFSIYRITTARVAEAPHKA